MKSAIRKPLSVLLTLTMVLSLFGGLTLPAYAASFSNWTEIRQYVSESNNALRDYGIDDMDPSYVATPFTDPAYAAVNAKARELADGLTTDMEKARAIYTFVAEECYYDYDYYYHGFPCPPTDPVTVFNEGVTVAAGYAGLLRVMLRAVGIPVRMVTGTTYSGYSLVRSSYHVLFREANHVWIEAYIDGAWRLCDPAWDSNNYFEYGEKHFNAASDSYFCDDPADFSRSHFTIGYYDELKIGDFIFSVGVDEKTVCGAADGVTPTSVVIPEGTTRIGDNAFKDCKTLASVSLPGTLTSIGSSAFSGCTSLTAVTGGENVTSVAGNAFEGCDALTAIPFPVDVGSNGKALQLNSGAAANITGAQTSAVYFGNYKQSSDGGDGYNVDPVKWRVLSNAEGKLFLLADQNLDVVRYNEELTEVTWETCTLRKWLNGCDGNPYEDSFIGNAFSDKETAAIAETAVVNDDNPGYGTPGGSDTTDKVFLLSIAQATDTAYGFTDNYDPTNTRVSRNTAYVASGGHTGGYMYAVGEADLWWLRSPGGNGKYSSVVDDDGCLDDDGDIVGYRLVAVRPAFNLNLNSVLFTSSAENGKAGDGALARIADYSGSEWKLTLLDDARAFAVTETEATAAAGGTATLTYTGAAVGTNEYVSAILTDADGSAVYYGRLTQPDAVDGTLTFTVPADLAVGAYTLKVFSEQYNGDNKTDYASAYSDVTLAVARPGNGKALQLTGGGEAANIIGAQQSSVYFGNYKQSRNSWDGFNVDPVKWRVLSNGEGKLFLLSDRNLDCLIYNNWSGSFTWETCALRKWLNDYDGNPYDGSFIGAAFSNLETEAIAQTAVVNDDNPAYGAPGGSDTADKVFLLSIAQATDAAYGFADNGDVRDARRVSTNTAYAASGGYFGSGSTIHGVGEADFWWLRTPGDSNDDYSVVSPRGDLFLTGFEAGRNEAAVRPALNVDLSRVLFTSAAVGGKAGDGTLAQIADYTDSEWKLTLLDDVRAFAVTETGAAATAGGTATITYTGAEVGTNEYVSAILTDETGSAVYYGRLAQPDAADGTLTFTVPADLASGSYTLKTFSEQYNGDNKTDYASAYSDVTLTVISQLDAAKAAAKAELDSYKDPADYRADEQAALAAAISAGKDAIDAAADAEAVATALTNAKTAIDAIKTDAELTAEETLAADKAAFDEYKTAQKAEAERLLQEGDSAESAALVETAKKAIDNTAYNEGANLAANKSVIDAIIAQLTDDLAAQRASEGAASYQSRPCPICGKTHSAGGVDNMLGEFHWYTYMFKYIFYSFLSIIGYDAPYAALKA